LVVVSFVLFSLEEKKKKKKKKKKKEEIKKQGKFVNELL